MDRVAAAVADLGLPPARLERLKTAVSEAAMNAIEYGSQGRRTSPSKSRSGDAEDVVVRITDHALSGGVPSDAEAPDIERSSPASRSRAGGGSS